VTETKKNKKLSCRKSYWTCGVCVCS